MRQLSFYLDTHANSDLLQVFSAPALINPSEFLGVVEQDGRVKLHALVQQNGPELEHEVLVVGTGKTIPDEYLNRMYKVGSLTLQGQYGYHIYYLGEHREITLSVPRTPVYALDIFWADNAGFSDSHDFERLNAQIDDFYSACQGVCAVDLDNLDNQISLRFYDAKDAKSPAFIELLAQVAGNAAVDRFNAGSIVGELA